MADFERDQFWQGLGRLYDSTQELKNRIERIADRIEGLAGVTESLGVSTAHIRDASANLVRVAEAHERRLDKV